MDESNQSVLPNIYVLENERVLAYLKEMHPFSEIIVPFSEKRVNQDTVPVDLVGRFSSMSSLPANSKYVVYGREALVHPETGIIFGFITGTTVIYRLPDPILKEVRESNLTNFRVMKDTGIHMENLESNWVSSPSITEPLVRKSYEFYSQASPQDEVVHLNPDVDLTTPRTREFENLEQRRRLLPLGVIIAVCALSILLLYAANYVLKLL